MSGIGAKRSFGAAAGLAILCVVALPYAPGYAASSRSEIEHRAQMMRNSADAANQRTQRERETVDRQRELLQYQIRRNQRLHMKMQCRAAGGASC